ncbi:hypothetical protein IQ10_01360 [Halalkalibacter nanhaiisediminis]|uniref:Uncharacterized protein n=1 Tax=Halalkalibacter nanhaiisediminis TaxID=688079 RepID=A0A562QMR4_9BACI|nr:hypothetical protein IQ10_01360 [Halalkalibacter nanhaiisediminis]
MKLELFLILFLSVIMISLTVAPTFTLPSCGLEASGWKYVGSHRTSKTTSYFETGSSTWTNRFSNGITKFQNENSGFRINKAAVGNTQNFIEPYILFNF